MKREVRSKSVGTKVTEAELRVLESRAERAGVTLSEWVRDVLLGSSVETGTLAAERAILAEVLAMRTILLNFMLKVGEAHGTEPSRDSDTQPSLWLDGLEAELSGSLQQLRVAADENATLRFACSPDECGCQLQAIRRPEWKAVEKSLCYGADLLDRLHLSPQATQLQQRC